MALTLYDKTERIDGMEEFLKAELIRTWTRAGKPEKGLAEQLEG